MNGICTANGLSSCPGKTDIAYLAGRNQISHGSDCFFERHPGINTVLIVEIDMINPEPLQRTLTGRTDILRPAAYTGYGRPASISRCSTAHDTELGGYDHLAAPSPDRSADQLFIGKRALHIRGIKKVHPHFQGTMDRGD